MIRCQFCHQDNPTGTACCARCGTLLSRPERPVTPTPELEKQIRSLIDEGSLIEAIKRFRELTGASIREAKDAVEAIEQGRPFPLSGQPHADFESELTGMLQAGRKIDAIKRFREQTGAGLKAGQGCGRGDRAGSTLSHFLESLTKDSRANSPGCSRPAERSTRSSGSGN